MFWLYHNTWIISYDRSRHYWQPSHITFSKGSTGQDQPYASHFCNLSRKSCHFSALILSAINCLVSIVRGPLSIDLSNTVVVLADVVTPLRPNHLTHQVEVEEEDTGLGLLVPKPFLSHLLLTSCIYFSPEIFFSTKQ